MCPSTSSNDKAPAHKLNRAAEPCEADGLVRVGLALRPHGVAGELLVMPLTDDPKRFSLLEHAIFEPRPPSKGVAPKRAAPKGAE